jgi:hypothetical protein
MKKVITAIIVTSMLAHPANAGTITGTVTRDSNGSPIAGLTVEAYDYGTNQYRDGNDTNANGIYIITGLATGTYRVSVMAPTMCLNITMTRFVGTEQRR